MDLDISIIDREEELKHINKYTQVIEKEINRVLDLFNWDKNTLLKSANTTFTKCPFDRNHKVDKNKLDKHIEKCILKRSGYDLKDQLFTEAPDNATATIEIDHNLQEEILKESFPGKKMPYREVPKTSDRLIADFTVDERLALYKYAVKMTKQNAPPVPPPLNFSVLERSVSPSTSTTQSEQEMYAKIRDLKRRRIKYKRIHTNCKNRTELQHELINNLMEEYTDCLKSKQKISHSPITDKKSTSNPSSRMSSIDKQTKSNEKYGKSSIVDKKLKSNSSFDLNNFRRSKRSAESEDSHSNYSRDSFEKRSRNRNKRSLSKSRSPRKTSQLRKSVSPINKSKSPLRKSKSPRHKSKSPRHRSKSPLKKSWTGRRVTKSPRNISKSPLRNSKSPRQISRSPFNYRPVSHSPKKSPSSPRRTSISPTSLNSLDSKKIQSPERGYSRSPKRFKVAKKKNKKEHKKSKHKKKSRTQSPKKINASQINKTPIKSIVQSKKIFNETKSTETPLEKVGNSDNLDLDEKEGIHSGTKPIYRNRFEYTRGGSGRYINRHFTNRGGMFRGGGNSPYFRNSIKPSNSSGGGVVNSRYTRRTQYQINKDRFILNRAKQFTKLFRDNLIHDSLSLNDQEGYSDLENQLSPTHSDTQYSENGEEEGEIIEVEKKIDDKLMKDNNILKKECIIEEGEILDSKEIS